ncbi:hypothetical protein IMSAGC022_00706 [Alistipes sp.]|nr:hypothetical protein IMSAGC022_00706 [Alistipes sp.]
MKTIILAAAAACLCWTASAQQTTTTTTTTTATTIVAADDAGQESDGGSGFEWSVGVDLNSNYVWRGYDQSANGKFFNLNIQPCVTLGYKGLWLELWDTNAFNGSYNEFDITLGYTIGGFEISVSDYYFDFESPYFSDYNASHSLCATVSYTLSERIPLKLSWSTTLAGEDFHDNGKRAYSSYVELSYAHTFDKLFDVEAAVGASPFKAPYWCYDDEGFVPDGFTFTNLELGLSREFEIGCATLPVSLRYIYNPFIHRSYGVLSVGVSFGN